MSELKRGRERSEPESAIVRFYRSRGTDQSGRSLEDILRWDDGLLEAVHDYIQWLFPLDEPSGANWSAPVLDATDCEQFKSDATLRSNLRRSLVRMLAFYGYQLIEDESPPAIRRAENWSERARVWLQPGNHNHLRLTRIMKCLVLLGLPDHARTLQKLLLDEAAHKAGAVSARTVAYWTEAIDRP